MKAGCNMPGPDFSQQPYFGPHDGGRFAAGGPGGGHDPLLMLLGLLLWLVIPAVIAYAVTRVARHREPALASVESQVTAAELLRRRYVLGDISLVTFEEMLENLLISESREEQMRRLTRDDWATFG